MQSSAGEVLGVQSSARPLQPALQPALACRQSNRCGKSCLFRLGSPGHADLTRHELVGGWHVFLQVSHEPFGPDVT